MSPMVSSMVGLWAQRKLRQQRRFPLHQILQHKPQ